MSPRGTGRSAPHRGPANAHQATLEPGESLSPRDQNRPTVPSFRGATCLEPGDRHEKMEERLRAPSIVPVALRASTRRRGLSSTPTPTPMVPGKAMLRASSLTIRHGACASVRHGRWNHPAPSRSHVDACASGDTACRGTPVFGVPFAGPCQRVRRVRHASSPFEGSPCG